MRMNLWQLVLIVLVILPVGCGQQTAAPVEQVTEQAAITPSTTEQEQAAQGSQVYVWVVNGPGSNGLPTAGMLDLKSDEALALIGQAAGATGGSATGVQGRFAQAGFSINIGTGAGPGQTGTTTGTTSGTSQTPSASSTAYPTQHVAPELSFAVPIGVAAPGGLVDQQATATGRGQTGEAAKTSTNDQRLARLEAANANIDRTLAVIAELLGVPESRVNPAATQPAQAGHEE